MEIIATNKNKNSLVKWNIKILQDFCNENQNILLTLDYSEMFINILHFLYFLSLGKSLNVKKCKLKIVRIPIE